MKNAFKQSWNFFDGDGEMPKRFRELDWEKTALGDVLTWPQSLRTSVGLILKSRFPMFIAWGPKRVFLYNDAYAPILGKKHESALGKEFEILWSEIWKDLIPLIETVDRGEAVYLEDLYLNMHRNGFDEDTYFTFSYSPILDETDNVQGLFCACVETTENVLRQRKLEQREGEASAERDNLLRLLEASPSPNVLWRTGDLIYERVTPSYQALFPRKVLIGKSFRKALPEKEYEHFFTILQGVFDTGTAVTMKEQVVPFDIDGMGMKDRYYTLAFFQIKDSDGNPYGVYQHADDNTEQVRAREILKESTKALEIKQNALVFERHKLEAIFSESPAAMALWRGPNFVYEMVNPQYQMMFDKELVGKKLTDVFPELSQSALPAIFKKVFETGESHHSREQLVRVSRTSCGPLEDRYFDNSFMRINNPDGTPYGIYNHALDVGDIVVARQQLEASKLEAERANQTKSSFLANMSHEIRTPLGAILGFSSLLKDGNIDLSEKDRYLDTIVRNGNALTKIIDDILDLAKVEAGKLNIEYIPFSLYTLASDVVDIFQDKTREKNIYLLLNIDEAVPSQICTDPTRLRQILVNLIGNAVKFTERGGVRINVRAAAAGANKTKIIFDIKDTGVGIDEEQKEKLFTPFTQADNSTTRKFGGTGLGLALSQRLSNALSGEITISQCKLGEGCTFTLTFEADLTANMANRKVRDSIAQDYNSVSLKGLRVLVVDDSIDNQFLVERLLTKNGAIVETAIDGEEGVSMALGGSYDVILMDIQMPKLDGYQAKKALDSHGYEKPVIALTAHAMSDEKVKTDAAGFASHLTKPLNRSELLKTLASYSKILN